MARSGYRAAGRNTAARWPDSEDAAIRQRLLAGRADHGQRRRSAAHQRELRGSLMREYR
jgi:hypothetical protein